MQRDHVDDFERKLGRPLPTRNRRSVNFSSHSTKQKITQDGPNAQAKCGSLDFRIPARSASKHPRPDARKGESAGATCVDLAVTIISRENRLGRLKG